VDRFFGIYVYLELVSKINYTNPSSFDLWDSNGEIIHDSYQSTKNRKRQICDLVLKSSLFLRSLCYLTEKNIPLGFSISEKSENKKLKNFVNETEFI